MSIRGFHIIFISLATLFCGFFAFWGFFLYDAPSEVMIDVLGWVCAGGVLIFPIYGIYFYKKVKHLNSK